MMLKAVKWAAVGLAACLIFFSILFFLRFSKSQGEDGRQVVYTVEKGSSARSIAQGLKSRSVLREKWPFFLGYRLFYRSKTIKAGEYALNLPISPKSILEKLTEGKVILHPLTIPEGLTQRETAHLLHSLLGCKVSDFLNLTAESSLIRDIDPEASSLEGYLFPETYRFPKNTDLQTIIGTMISQFRRVFLPEWRTRAEEMGMSVRETVILASLIEKETSLPAEKPLISAVFHNRLRKGIKLDCDPTIIYALKEDERFDGNLRKKDLSLDSPYNTYLYRGLPPGPIANPGSSSIEAALYPAKKDYLYFVSKNDGSHHFSSSFREHLNAVNRFQRKH